MSGTLRASRAALAVMATVTAHLACGWRPDAES